MKKQLKVAYEEKCTGCELCILDCQRQLGKVGLEDSFIRIFKKKKENNNFLKFSVNIDPQVNNLDVIRIVSSCPTGVLESVDEDTNE